VGVVGTGDGQEGKKLLNVVFLDYVIPRTAQPFHSNQKSISKQLSQNKQNPRQKRANTPLEL
jgi:hypothetical protein